MDTPNTGTSTVFKSEGRTYAIGLFWQPAESKTTLRREAVEFAGRAGGGDVIALRSSSDPTQDINQFGVGSKSEGLSVGAIAAAAAAADNLPGTWMGVFEIPDRGWWFIAVRDDQIEADCDVFYTDEDQAQRRFISERVRNRPRSFAPESWDFRVRGNSEPANLTGILGSSKGPKLINATLPYDPTRLILWAGIAILALIMAGWWYSNYRANKAAEAERAKAELEEQLRLRPKFVMVPWAKNPNTEQWILNCGAALEKLPMSIPAYDLKTLECSGNQAKSTYQYKNGLPSWAASWFVNHPIDGMTAHVEPSGQIATAQIEWTVTKAQGNLPIYSIANVQRALNERALALHDSISKVDPILDYSPLIKGEQLKDANAAAPWVKIHYRIDTKTAKPWFDLLIQMPGTMLSSVVYDPSKKIWTIVGDTYALR